MVFVNIERHVRENSCLNRLFLDIDVPIGRPEKFTERILGFWIPKHWIDFNTREFLELVVLDVGRLLQTFPKLGGIALIYRSSLTGFHVRFPKAKLSFEEVEAMQFQSLLCHEGYRYFCRLVQDETLRVSGKRGAREPQLIIEVRSPHHSIH